MGSKVTSKDDDFTALRMGPGTALRSAEKLLGRRSRGISGARIPNNQK